jgi:uncharacterized membrane protein
MPSDAMYLFLKLIHVTAVVLFLGNIITGVFWKIHADRSDDPAIIAHTMDGIIRADRLFTVPGVILIVIGGFGAASVGHLPMLRTRWILAGIVLLTLSGIAFMGWLVPVQRKLHALSRAAEGDPARMDWDGYKRLSRQWNVSGLIALLAPILALVLMVLKPR